jgi:hypothetical protein
VTEDWIGGQIEISPAQYGWGIKHRRKDNALYGLGWQKYRTAAIEEGKRHAGERKARLLIEVPL